MGYETKIYVGTLEDRFPSFQHRGYSWLRDFARIELYRTGDSKLFKLFEQYKTYHTERPASVNKVFIYADDGNTRIKKDKYDDLLIAAPLKEVIDALEEDCKDADFSTSHTIATLEYLEAVRKNWYNHENVYVVRFAH